MILQLSIEERRQGADGILLCLSNILHALEDVFGAVVKLCFVDAQLLFEADVILFRFLNLAHGGIVGKSAAFELLSGDLLQNLCKQSCSDYQNVSLGVTTYLILLHHGEVSLNMLHPGGIGTVQVGGLKLGELFVGAAHGRKATAVFGVWQLCRMGRHGFAEVGERQAATSVLESVAMAGEPSGVDVHRFEEVLHACRWSADDVVVTACWQPN